MLRLSIQPESDGLRLRVEGKLISPWTEELEKLWSQMKEISDARKLFLDLRGMTFVDRTGMQLLRNIVKAHNPIILADSPLTRQFAEQARQAEARARNQES